MGHPCLLPIVLWVIPTTSPEKRMRLSHSAYNWWIIQSTCEGMPMRARTAMIHARDSYGNAVLKSSINAARVRCAMPLHCTIADSNSSSRSPQPCIPSTPPTAQ